MASEDLRVDPTRECVHKTKVIQFLGRTMPIILQNENGPCPLLSICNVLLLKNNLNLSPDLHEVSQEKLLSLVAERLIDANSNFEDKDPDYIKNQQQNISDAIDLLPRLTTGIDVNLKFTGIRDFEFTPECAIFDLLDIPLYHGWIVDPQDLETAGAIGSKSYNRIMSELVSLETRAVNVNDISDFVDLYAATTAALGIPSPTLSSGRSFDESPRSVGLAENSNDIKKGDMEENEELLRALKLSEDPYSPSKDNSASPISEGQILTDSHIGVEPIQVNPFSSVDPEKQATSLVEQDDSGTPPSSPKKSNDHENQTSVETTSEPVDVGKEIEPLIHETRHFNDAEDVSCVDTLEKSTTGEVTQSKPGNNSPSDEASVNDSTAISVQADSETFASSESGPTSIVTNHTPGSLTSLPDNFTSTSSDNPETINCTEMDTEDSKLVRNRESCSFSSNSKNDDEVIVPDTEAKEPVPVYEGEKFVLDSGKTSNENSEPMYEGEVVLAEQADHGTVDHSTVSSKDGLSATQGELVQNFLRANASQLSIYGLFCLQEGLKERELCVFFRNNHFNTMFKYEGELYLLATDQGYISQPDLVWEKLNEVNGNTVFMTSNFKEFKLDNHINSETWDEQTAMASTAEYLNQVDNSAAAEGSNFNSDLQLAIALQQQEFDQQQQSQRPTNPQPQPQQQAPSAGSSRLITGPQLRRNNERSSSSSSSSARQETKSKEKCSIM